MDRQSFCHFMRQIMIFLAAVILLLALAPTYRAGESLAVFLLVSGLVMTGRAVSSCGRPQARGQIPR
jgi:hypothetical protein